MEFLDPSEKRARTQRLFLGYGLLAIVVALATLILVYQAQGYDYDRNKGVTRNGLLFVDSQPVSAAININGADSGEKTNARLDITEGEHTVKLTAEKYREWSKTFIVEGGSVKFLLYPRLFPTDIPIGITRVFQTAPAWASQSPDRQWLVLQQKADAPVLTIIDLMKPAEEPAVFAMPQTIIANQSGKYGTLKPLEWANDNKHVLLQQNLPNGKIAYIQFNRENPDESINVTSTLKLVDGQIPSLRDKKYDKFYVFTPTSGELRIAELKNPATQPPFLTGVVSFKSHGDDLVLYVTYDGAKENEANVFAITDQKNKFALQALPRDSANYYLLDLAKFRTNWYFVVGTASNNFVRIYRDPLSKTKPNTAMKAMPTMSLRIDNPRFVSFSDNARTIAIQSGQQFVVFDAEEARLFRYTTSLSLPIDYKAKWMDGHRIMVVSNSEVYVFDFDGTNTQKLVGSRPEFLPYFDRDYKILYTLINQADGKIGFQNAQMVVAE
jgi:PEGA domain